MSKIWVSPTRLARYDDCARAYYAYYEVRLEPDKRSCALAVGDAVDAACSHHLQALCRGAPSDPVAAFERRWDAIGAREEIEYSARWTPEKLRATGRRLAELFPAAWNRSGIVPLMRPDGEPLVQPRLALERPGGIVIEAILDVIAALPDGRIAAIDLKTPAAEAPDPFLHVADQLTFQQLLVEHHADALGLGRLDAVGYMEGLKRTVSARGRGPEWIGPRLVPARSPTAIDAFLERVAWFADSVRRRRFPRTPRMAYNTPCALCDFAGWCISGDREGLKVRPKRAAR